MTREEKIDAYLVLLESLVQEETENLEEMIQLISKIKNNLDKS